MDKAAYKLYEIRLNLIFEHSEQIASHFFIIQYGYTIWVKKINKIKFLR